MNEINKSNTIIKENESPKTISPPPPISVAPPPPPPPLPVFALPKVNYSTGKRSIYFYHKIYLQLPISMHDSLSTTIRIQPDKRPYKSEKFLHGYFEHSNFSCLFLNVMVFHILKMNL